MQELKRKLRHANLSTINRWIVLSSGMFSSFMLLVLIPKEQFVLRSISITLIASFCICHYLYRRYLKGLTLQADMIISISTLAQFLLPVFYLAPYYNTNPNMDIWNHRYGFALTSFAVFLGQIMFFCGYESIRKGLNFPPVNKTLRHIKMGNMFIVLAPLIVLIWFSRIILLQKGYYYQIHTSDFQFISPYFSVLAQLSRYGLIIVIALFVMVFLERDKKKQNRELSIAILVFLIEIGWYIPSGSRGTLVLTVLGPIFAYIFITRRLPKKTIILILLLGIPILSVLYSYRYVASQYFSVSEINLQKVPDAFLSALDRTEKEEKGSKVYGIMDRFYDGKNLTHLLIHYSHDYNYEFGATYKNILYIFAPRLLYHNKPVFTTPLGKWYKLVGGGSTPITFWGESYINFSWFGIIVCSYLLGVFMKCYDYVFIRNAHKPYWCFIYVFGAITILQLPVEAFVIWVSYLTKFVMIAFILTYWYLILKKSVSVEQRHLTIIKKL